MDQQTLFTMNAIPFVYMAQAKGLANNAGVMQTCNLNAPDGRIKMSIDPQLFARFPVQLDDGVLVLVYLTKATAQNVGEGSGLFVPDHKIVKPS